MKRLLPAAAALASLLAVARADEGAYRSLVGMARAAEAERKPAPPESEEAARIPAKPEEAALDGASAARAADASLKDALRDALSDVPAPARRTPEPAPAAGPRPWTRLYSTLVPSWRKMPVLGASFEAPRSTAAASALRPLTTVVPLDSEAVKAGERRGLAELLSSPVAPADAK